MLCNQRPELLKHRNFSKACSAVSLRLGGGGGGGGVEECVYLSSVLFGKDIQCKSGCAAADGRLPIDSLRRFPF